MMAFVFSLRLRLCHFLSLPQKVTKWNIPYRRSGKRYANPIAPLDSPGSRHGVFQIEKKIFDHQVFMNQPKFSRWFL